MFVDHIDPKEKLAGISAMSYNSNYSLDDIIQEVKNVEYYVNIVIL